MQKGRRYTPQEKAGMKLLAFAIKRNVDRVERRYRNQATRELCQGIAATCDLIIDYVERDVLFTIYVGTYPSLPNFFDDDVAYSEVE